MIPFFEVTTMPMEVSPLATPVAVGFGIFAGIMGLIWLVFGLGSYVWLSLCLYKIAQRVNAENPWYAWIPILNMVLMLQIAKKPMWWLVMILLVPFANIVFLIMMYVEFFKILGKPGWWTLLLFLPFGAHIVFGILAFERKESTPLAQA